MREKRRPQKIGVIGAGMAGLIAATRLAKGGHIVTLFERAKYPGGTAGYYFRQGVRYPTGATLSFGMEADGPLRRLLADVDIQLKTTAIDHCMDVVLEDRVVHLFSDRTRWRTELSRVFPERSDDVIRFWMHLSRVADTVYRVSKAFASLPIQRVGDLGHLPKAVIQSPRDFIRLLPETRWTVADALRQYDLLDYKPFRRFLDAQLIDAAQVDARQAAWLPSAVALDIYRYGVHAVDGGFPAIADALLARAREYGTRILMSRTVDAAELDTDNQRWRIWTNRREALEFDILVNATGTELRGLSALRVERREINQGAMRDSMEVWGAVRLDAVVPTVWIKSMDLPVETAEVPFAIQLANNQEIAALTGDQLGAVYVTVHPTDETRSADEQVLTVSVHTTLDKWMGLTKAEYVVQKKQMTDALVAHVGQVLPGFQTAMHHLWIGTPVTYHRYLLKPSVGGTPLTVDTAVRRPSGSRTPLSGLYLAGDSVFPGPGTLSAALSGFFAARAIDPLTAKSLTEQMK